MLALILTEVLDASMRGNGVFDTMSQSAYHVTGFASTSDDSSDVSSPNAGPSPSGMKLASIKTRPQMKRMNSSPQYEEGYNLYENSHPQLPTGKPPKVYASVAEMKKAKAQKARMVADSTRLHKDFRSTPDLQGEVLPVVLSQRSLEEKRKSLSQEDLFLSAQNVVNQRHSVAFPTQHTNLVERRMVMSQEYNGVLLDERGARIETYEHPRLRRSHSAINANQLKAGVHPPPSHPPPPVPKSDYASVGKESAIKRDDSSESSLSPEVMSSFRPTDSAKLYASPGNIKSIGTKPNGNINGKNGNSKSRSQSLPPGANRHQNNGIMEKENTEDSEIYSTKYSTFRGNINVSQENKNEFPQEKINYARPNIRSLSESSSRTIINKKYERSVSLSKPNIPNPDYSSEDDSAYSLQEELPVKKIKSLKKKKHTVMFAPNLVSSCSHDMSDVPHYAAPSKVPPLPPPPPPPSSDSSNFADLIAQKVAERNARQQNGGGSAPASTTSSPNKKKNEGNNKDQSLCLTDAIKASQLFNKQRDKVSDKLSPVTQAIIKNVCVNNLKPIPILISKEDPKQKMKNSRSYPNEFNIEDGDNSSSGVSSDQEQIHQEMNYVTVINTESEIISDTKAEKVGRRVSRDDSSEASESSDEASDRTWILTNDKGDKSDSGKDSDSSGGSRRSGTLTRNAVSLIKLPPPQEISEPDIYHEANNHSSRLMTRSMDQDTISTVSSLSSLSSSSGSSMDSYQRHSSSMSRSLTQPLSHNISSSTLYSHRSNIRPSVSHAIQSAVRGETLNRSRPLRTSPQMWSADAESIGGSRERAAFAASRSATLDRNFNSSKGSKSVNPNRQLDAKYDRSIEQSLQLIRMHMNSLNEVNTLAGITGGKVRSASTSDMVLAPPPQFCDKSLANARGNRGGKTVIHITGDNREPDLPVQIIRTKKTGVDDRTFRNKFLCEWSTRDTTDWLESLFMPEYKDSFTKQDIDGVKLMRLNNESLINLGIRKIGHRVKMEKSLKRYRPVERIDL